MAGFDLEIAVLLSSWKAELLARPTSSLSERAKHWRLRSKSRDNSLMVLHFLLALQEHISISYSLLSVQIKNGQSEGFPQVLKCGCR